MKKLLLFLLFLGLQTTVFSQQLESILLAAADAEKLTQAYIDPALKGVVYSMNDGWYTTGKTHELFGFDITLGANLALVPNKDKDFLFRSSDYNFVTSQQGSQQTVSTVLGDDTDGRVFDVRVPVGDGTIKVAQFEMPGGIGADFPLKGVPGPIVQVGLGIPYKTDLKLRLLPNIGVDDKVKNFLIGLGLQHNISQYIPAMEESPFSLSALVAYGHTKVTYAIDDEDATDDVIVQNGEAEFKLNTLSIQAIGSVDLKIVDFYGSIGFGRGGSKLALNGDYTLTYQLEDENGNTIGSVQETLNNPLNFKSDVSSVRLSLGTRFNLSVFKLFASYALQEYSNISAGIAVSIR
ncbi:MAG: DUF6588 family protein [Flavobacteriaceae bacterium]